MRKEEWIRLFVNLLVDIFLLRLVSQNTARFINFYTDSGKERSISTGAHEEGHLTTGLPLKDGWLCAYRTFFFPTHLLLHLALERACFGGYLVDWDEWTSHHLLLAGLPPYTTSLSLYRLLVLATPKLIVDKAADAYLYSRMRTSATGAGPTSNLASTAAKPFLYQGQDQYDSRDRIAGRVYRSASPPRTGS